MQKLMAGCGIHARHPREREASHLECGHEVRNERSYRFDSLHSPYGLLSVVYLRFASVPNGAGAARSRHLSRPG